MKLMKFLIAGLLCSLLGGVVVTAFAGGSAKISFSKVDNQQFTWRDEAISTSSEEFERVPGLDLTPCNRGGLTIEVNGDLVGGPVEIRVVKGPGEGTPLLPGVAHFDSSVDAASFSFTFGLASKTREIRDFHVEWRSPTGKEITLNYALVRVLYNASEKVCF